MTSPIDNRFTVIMPMKSWDRAKSRLHADPRTRRALAEAFSRDALETVLRCPEVARVVVVTRGDLVVEYVCSVGAIAIQEPTDRPLDTLGAAVAHGIAWADQHHPSSPLAVIPSDLPALTSRDLQSFLHDARRHRLAFARDADGSGTTILTSRRPSAMTAAYGEESAARHLKLGGFELEAPDCVRRDVDRVDDLIEARRLGLGFHTQQVLSCVGDIPRFATNP